MASGVAAARAGGRGCEDRPDRLGRGVLRACRRATRSSRGAFAARWTLPRALPPAPRPRRPAPSSWRTPAARLGLPHFSAAAVARLLEDAHREVGRPGAPERHLRPHRGAGDGGAAMARARGAHAGGGAGRGAPHGRRASTATTTRSSACRKPSSTASACSTCSGEKVAQVNGLTRGGPGRLPFRLPGAGDGAHPCRRRRACSTSSARWSCPARSTTRAC